MAPKAANPHVVCVPMPWQGHITGMLNLAKLLHHKGSHITFVNTEFNHKRILDARGPTALDGLPDFRFETLPIGPPPSNSNTVTLGNSNAINLAVACSKNFLAPFRDLIARLNDNATTFFSNPPVTCILYDIVLNMDLHQELGIKCVLFCPLGASGFKGFKYTCDQLRQCLLLKDPSKLTDLDKNFLIKLVPQLKAGQVTNLFDFTEANFPEVVTGPSKWDTEKTLKASAVVFPTFDALESKVLHDLSSMSPRVYSVGPLPLLLNQIPNTKEYDSINCSVWNQETKCIKWLDSKEPNSVIYISFGSMVEMTLEKLIEFAWGLANSNQNFLWIIRPDLVLGDQPAILPQEFLFETKERGFMTSWCPQQQVLQHPSVKGFVNHAGWNSVIETICAGVPMICWPSTGETSENCCKSCDDWGIAMELSQDFKRDEVEELVRELMTGEKGKKMKNRAMEWKRMAEEAVSAVGSSSLNLDSLVNEVLMSEH